MGKQSLVAGIFWVIMAWAPMAVGNVLIERSVQIRGFTIKIGPMEQKVEPREQLVKYYVSSHGVRIEAVIGLRRRVVVFNRRANKIWTLDTTDSTYYEGALSDYAGWLGAHPAEKTNVTQDLPIVPLKFSAAKRQGRFNGRTCQLFKVDGQDASQSHFCIVPFAGLGLTEAEAQSYRAFLTALANEPNEVMRSLIYNWQDLVGSEGFDIFGRYFFSVSGLPVQTAVTTTLSKMERRVIGSNLFSPPEAYTKSAPGENGAKLKNAKKSSSHESAPAESRSSQERDDIVDLHE